MPARTSSTKCWKISHSASCACSMSSSACSLHRHAHAAASDTCTPGSAPGGTHDSSRPMGWYDTITSSRARNFMPTPYCTRARSAVTGDLCRVSASASIAPHLVAHLLHHGAADAVVDARHHQPKAEEHLGIAQPLQRCLYARAVASLRRRSAATHARLDDHPSSRRPAGSYPDSGKERAKHSGAVGGLLDARKLALGVCGLGVVVVVDDLLRGPTAWP